MSAIITRSANGSVGLWFLRPRKAASGPFEVVAQPPLQTLFSLCFMFIPEQSERLMENQQDLNELRAVHL